MRKIYENSVFYYQKWLNFILVSPRKIFISPSTYLPEFSKISDCFTKGGHYVVLGLVLDAPIQLSRLFYLMISKINSNIFKQPFKKIAYFTHHRIRHNVSLKIANKSVVSRGYPPFPFLKQFSSQKSEKFLFIFSDFDALILTFYAVVCLKKYQKMPRNSTTNDGGKYRAPIKVIYLLQPSQNRTTSTSTTSKNKINNAASTPSLLGSSPRAKRRVFKSAILIGATWRNFILSTNQKVVRVSVLFVRKIFC